MTGTKKVQISEENGIDPRCSLFVFASPDVIPGEFNFLTPLDSYLFIVLLHFFLLTLYMLIESLRRNLVKVV